MVTETVSALQVTAGDAIRIDGQPGWWIVDSAFEEGTGGPIDIDLTSEDDEFGYNWDEFGYNWHVSPDHQVERRVP